MDLSPQRERNICDEINEDHACTVYALVMSSLPSQEARSGIQNTKLKSINSSEMKLSFETCGYESSGGLCHMREAIIKFDPVLASSEDVL